MEIGAALAVVGIHDQVRAGLNFGDSGIPAGDVVGAGSTGAYNFDRNTCALDEITTFDQETHGGVAGLHLFKAGRLSDSTFIAHEAAKSQAFFQHSPSKPHRRFSRLGTATV